MSRQVGRYRRIPQKPRSAAEYAHAVRLCVRPARGRVLSLCKVPRGGRRCLLRAGKGARAVARSLRRVRSKGLCAHLLLRGTRRHRALRPRLRGARKGIRADIRYVGVSQSENKQKNPVICQSRDFWCVRRGSNPDRRRRRPLWYPIPPRAQKNCKVGRVSVNRHP